MLFTIMAKQVLNPQVNAVEQQVTNVADLATDLEGVETSNVVEDAADLEALETAEVAENEDAAADEEVDIFASLLADDADDAVVKSYDDVIKELMSLNTVKRLNNLTIKNIVVTKFDTHSLMTFVVKESVIGDAYTGQTDAFGQPIVALGKTHNIQSSSFAIASIMKESPKQAIFAQRVVDDPNFANMLFAGGKVDILMEYVAANKVYTNPFSSKATPVVFNKDKMIHHVIRLELGEVGQDVYQATIRG